MSKKSISSRRDFLKQSASLAAAGSVIPYFAWSRSPLANRSPNDRPRIGCIGVGSMGTGDARDHAKFGDVLAVCDVDSRHADAAKADEKIGKGKADSYGDYRRVLDRSDIDVVSVVTPDHWHVKIAIEALEAGKHVFCQKPLTLTLEENQLIRVACQKHKDKIFLVGTQQRSDRNLFLRAVNMIHKGLLGDIQKVTVGIDGSPSGGPFPKVDPPKELDWKMWLGQAPLVEYVEKRCHYEFRWWYEYSGGKFTDWGAHSHPWVIHSVAVLTFFLSAYRFHLIQNSADADIARKLQFCVLATGLVYGLFGCDGRSVRVRELAVGSLDDLPECDRGRQCSYPRPQLKTEPMVPGFVADALVWRPPVSRRVARNLNDHCVRAFPGVPP